MATVVLRPVNLHWIQNAADDPADLCAHGDIEFRIGEDVLLDRTAGQDVTVSAAALYLLRTLSRPHTRTAPVGSQLFPCCGFAMFDMPGQDEVAICGCGSGADFEVDHRADGSGVSVRSQDGRKWAVEWPEWKAAVFDFADRVSAFYAASAPKQPYDEESAAGFRKFVAEWLRRRGQPLSAGFAS
jgi:hypothetical protein